MSAMRIIATILVLTFCCPAGAFAQIRVKPEHAASRLSGWKLAATEDTQIMFETTDTGSATVALESADPLEIETVEGGTARLRPGWDGTVGYSHYALELTSKGAGALSVRLKRSLPPQTPQQTSAVQMLQFRNAFSQRPSKPPQNGEDFSAWQQRHRELLRKVLMSDNVPERVPLDAEILSTDDFPLFTLQRIRYRSRTDRTSVLLLSVPRHDDTQSGSESTETQLRGSQQPGSAYPLLLALHGHEADWGDADRKAWTTGHSDDFVAWFAERGWAVLQPATMNHKLQNPDWTLQGEWTWDAMVALDYAATVPQIDSRHVAVCGLSTGGHLAMNMLALDDRVQAGVVGCILSTWNHYQHRLRIPPHCDCGIHGQLSGVLEQCDWAALAAPKAVLFQHGRKDAAYCPGADEHLLDLKWNTGILPEEEFATMFDEVRRAWQLSGRTDGVSINLHDGAHQVDNESAFQWLSHSTDAKHQPNQ